MTTRSSKTTKAKGLRLTERDRCLLRSLWEYRQLMQPEIEQLVFPGLAHRPSAWHSHVPGDRLRRLVSAGFLISRPCPLVRPAGRPPLVYSLGKEGAGIVAQQLGISLTTALTRSRKDARRSWFRFSHDNGVSRCRIALVLACEKHGYELTWETDEQVAARHETTAVDGKPMPVRPDAFFTIRFGEGKGRASFFLEYQHESLTAAFVLKAKTYEAFWRSGAYQQRFAKTLRVLAVTGSSQKTANLIRAVERLGYGAMFYATTHTELTSDPLGAIWRVAGLANFHSLVGASSLAPSLPPQPQLADAGRASFVPANRAFDPAAREHPLEPGELIAPQSGKGLQP